MPSVLAAEFAAIDEACLDALAWIEECFGAPARSRARRGSGAPLTADRPFWNEPGGLRLSAVWYDPGEDVFVVTFDRGAMYRVPRSRLPNPGTVLACALDDLRHGVGVAFVDGSSTDFASDWVLYECDDRYRAEHTRRGDLPNFGGRVRSIRMSKGLKAAEVAQASGMAASNYARLEASRHRPSIETLARVAGALGVPLAALVART